MTLDEGQKLFIKNKVKQLGSVNATKAFYSSKGGKLSVVCQYAREYAAKIFNGNKK